MGENTPQKDSRSLQVYRLASISIGAAAFLYALVKLDYWGLGIEYLVFCAVTVIFASRIVVQIPKTKGFVSVSDTFVFLSIFLFGGYAGIVLATIDAIQPSRKLAKKKVTFFFNIAVLAMSTSATVYITQAFYPSIKDLASGPIDSEYIIAVCLMGFIQYVTNSGLIATIVALRTRVNLWTMWRENFLWTSLTYFAGSSAAALIAKLVAAYGVAAFFAAMPIVAVIYFTYTTYLKNVESAATQAELAQKHVAELSHHIAEQARISLALKESEEYFRTAFDNAAGMAVIDTRGHWLQVNESLCTMLGYTETDLLTNGFQSITHPNDLGNDLGNLYQLLEGNIPSYQLEKRYVHKSGETVWVLQSASLIRDAEDNPRHVVFQIQNISDRKKAEEQIHHAAFHDALTGLPNRTLFSDRLSMAVERAKRDAKFQFAVIFVDLDRFKVVNDSLGHDMGDTLLIALSRRIELCLRGVDTIARLGGDEFAILIDGATSLKDATRVADRIQESLAQPFDLGGNQFFATASMGISYSSQEYERPEDILRDSDMAMYKAKANGKARYEVFDSGMHSRAVEALTLENELRRGIERCEIVPFFQPIVELATGRVVGFEALARWVHPIRGLISPADFIPLAEETGLIVQIGHTILKDACRVTSEWRKKYDLPELSISVNLSSKQFKHASLLQDIKQVLATTGLDPRFLKLEITETIVMEDTDAAVEMLTQLKSLGVKISIDDFGTGYSSLSYLHKYPFDIIKVDRSFTSRMTTERESLGIVKTITALASELGKSVIAEGVELREHERILNEIGCDYGQGYLYSKPVPAAEALALFIAPELEGAIELGYIDQTTDPVQRVAAVV